MLRFLCSMSAKSGTEKSYFASGCPCSAFINFPPTHLFDSTYHIFITHFCYDGMDICSPISKRHASVTPVISAHSILAKKKCRNRSESAHNSWLTDYALDFTAHECKNANPIVVTCLLCTFFGKKTLDRRDCSTDPIQVAKSWT